MGPSIDLHRARLTPRCVSTAACPPEAPTSAGGAVCWCVGQQSHLYLCSAIGEQVFMSTGFNGLGMHLGNLSRLSGAQTRSISAENLTAPREGRTAQRGPAPMPRASWGAGRSRPSIHVAGQRDGHAGRHRRAGRDPAYLADGSPDHLAHGWCCASTGTARRRPRSKCRSAISSATAGASAATSARCPIAVNPAGGFNSYWEMPFRKQRADHHREPRPRRGRAASTTRSTTP